MHGLLRRPGYRLYRAGSPEAEAVLAEVAVTRADLDCALAALERSQGIRIRSIIGINHDGVFGSTREGWHPDLPDACKEPFVPLLWLQILELLGRVPEGSTARFLQDGNTAGLIGPDLQPHAAAAVRPAATSSKLRPSPSRVATSPVHSCQRRIITSQYRGSSSTSRACRPALAHAISVEPEPPKGSSTISRVLLEFRIARSTRATGFIVGWRSFLAGLSKCQTSP